jgi:nitronate monooxygenase
MPIWAGEAVDLISDLDSASALVARIAQQAEDVITAVGNSVVGPRVGQ